MVFSTFTGEFSRHADEHGFLHQKLADTRKLLGFTLVFCTLFYLAFSLTDLAALGAGHDFLLLCGARAIVGVTAGSCAWLAYRKPLSVKATRIAASVAEGVALACFMLIAAKRPAEFHWHAMSLAIMLIVIYLYIPNSFINALTLALAATVAILLLALRLAQMTPADMVTMSMLLMLANAFGALAARRFNRASREEYLAQTRLKFAAERDHLTACFNRRYLHENLMSVEFKGAQSFGRSLTAVVCDIDNFKRINDTYGHTDGDAVICAFAALLKESTREGIDTVVRYGGEEFLLVLPDTGLEDGIRLAERLRQAFASTTVPSTHGAGGIRTSASFGVATADVDGGGARPPVRDLIAMADKLMYEAKRGGRDCVRAAALPAPGAADAQGSLVQQGDAAGDVRRNAVQG